MIVPSLQVDLFVPAPTHNATEKLAPGEWWYTLESMELYMIKADLPSGFISVAHASLHSICGDGLCSVDEAEAALHGMGGCPADCPPITVCPGSDIYDHGDRGSSINGSMSIMAPIFPLLNFAEQLGAPQV